MASSPKKSHRENLLEGALLCLQERGYARTTARDIVAASGGANLGAIGYHYGSTERLLNQALLIGFERWYEQLAAAAQRAAHESQPLLVIARELPGTFEQNRPLVRAFIEAVAQADHSAEVRAGLLDCYARGREMLAELFFPDVPRGPQMRPVFSFLLAIFDGLLLQWLLDPEQALDGEELAGLTALLAPSLIEGTKP